MLFLFFVNIRGKEEGAYTPSATLLSVNSFWSRLCFRLVSIITWLFSMKKSVFDSGSTGNSTIKVQWCIKCLCYCIAMHFLISEWQIESFTFECSWITLVLLLMTAAFDSFVSSFYSSFASLEIEEMNRKLCMVKHLIKKW